MAISKGLKITQAKILGNIRKFGEFTPIMSNASICSETLMVPILEAIYDPTLPARIKLIIVGENSNTKTAFVAYPTNEGGIGKEDESKLLNIWIATTAPTNIEVKITSPKELTPRSLISLMNSFQKTLIFWGFCKDLPRRIMYSPIAVKNFFNMLLN
jgi:hypothetical protein